MTKTAKRLTAAVLSLALVITLIPLMSLTAHAETMNRGTYVVDLSVFDAQWEESEKMYEDFKAMEDSLHYMDVTFSGNTIDLDNDGKADIKRIKEDSVVTYQAASTRSKDLFVLTLTASQEEDLNLYNDYEHPYYKRIIFNFKANQGSRTLDMRSGPVKFNEYNLDVKALYATTAYLSEWAIEASHKIEDLSDWSNPYVREYDLDGDGSVDVIEDTSKKERYTAAPTRSVTKYVIALSDAEKLSVVDVGSAFYEKLTFLLPDVTGRTKITSLTNASKGFKLVWTKVSGAAGYEVWRSENGGKYIKAKTVAGGSTTTYTNSADAANKNGVKYQYKVRAYKGSGKTLRYFPYSAVRTTYKVTTPAAPSVVNADKGFKITWSKNSKASGYEIYRSADDGKTYTKVKTITGAGTTSFNNTADAANKNGVKYKYKIRAFKTVSGVQYNSAFSPVKTCYKVVQPTIKTISNTGKGIKLTWAKNSKATGYQIWRSDDGGKSYIKAKTISNPNTTSFSNSAANKNGKKYYYKMRSYKTVSGTTYYSAYSPVKTITRKV